jgi:hypothetical protein
MFRTTLCILSVPLFHFCNLFFVPQDCARGALVPQRVATTGRVKSDGAIIRGKIEFDKERLTSWNGGDLVVPFNEFQTKLYEQIELPPVPVPENWKEMKPEEQQTWAKEFEESDAGKEFIADREKRIAAARDFDVVIEKDGTFVVYDVPPGVFDLRGRVDKLVNGTVFGLEVFGRIDVAPDMDEIRLPPIQVAATPMLKAGETAPPISVETHDGSSRIELATFAGNYLLLSFWIASSPSAEYQTTIQAAFAKIKDRYPVRLLSICVDENPNEGIKFILQKELKLGSHGFTRGFEHRTMFDYGVRAIPTFWLISPDGKIAMTPGDFAIAFRAKSDLSEILADKIEGKDVPTPAVKPNADENSNNAR